MFISKNSMNQMNKDIIYNPMLNQMNPPNMNNPKINQIN